ncbi:MAG TPA: hypothetical protein VFU02_08685 [Polyangiaceae bacterium]|nr:hypothetical protein [Polyangiaceae bacterium]
MDGGQFTLVRDGQRFETGLFGAGVTEAVEGNPAAVEHARTYRQYTIAGWSLYVGGLAFTLTGAGLLGAGQRNDNPTQEHTGEALLLAGLATFITGMGFLIGAQPHLWDAINLYNDGVDRRARERFWPAPTVPPYTLPGTPAPPVLAPAPLAPQPREPSPSSPQGSPLNPMPPGSVPPGSVPPGSVPPAPAPSLPSIEGSDTTRSSE